MKPLARAATNANREYLRTGLQYARAMPAHAAGATPPEGTPTVEEADIAWRLARKNVHIDFSNFAEAFYRLLSEPRPQPEIGRAACRERVCQYVVILGVAV